MQSLRVVRKVLNLPARRKMSIFDTKNEVAAHRAKYYTNPAVGLENPTYLKEPGDKLVVAFGFLSVTVGLTMIFRGLYSMTFGVNKIQKA